ncbi:MAG TPA: SDR family oxidoreductase [Burkholderiales bacterium]|nr:SDR family oxidoreductase [Burkholderiales bacterium]
MTTVLVTGAGGFVGSVLRALLQQEGHDVRAALRTPPSGTQGPAFAVGDIGPDTDWSAALAGCEAVVHLAAHVHVMRGRPGADAPLFERVNVQGSGNLARQAARAGVRRFVFLSSVKVNGESTAGRPFTERDALAPADAYGRSKMQAETALRGLAAETGMELAILRPPLVYGPGVKANFLQLLRLVDRGVPLPLASIDNRRSLVYVGNLAHAIACCVTHAGAAGRTFFVSDDHDMSTPELVRGIARALGRRPALFPFPPCLLAALAAVAGRREQAARLTQSLQVDISAIKSALGWRPPAAPAEALAQTAAWYRSR